MDLDLSEILAQSRATAARLEAAVSRSGSESIPRLDRALPLIDRKSSHLKPAINTGPFDEADAGIRLLSQYGFDADRIERNIDGALLLPETDIPDEDVDARLSADHEARVVSALASAFHEIQSFSMNAVSAALDAEWDSAKRNLLSLPNVHTSKPRPSRRSIPSTAPGGVLASPFRILSQHGDLSGDTADQSQAVLLKDTPSKAWIRTQALGSTRLSSLWTHANSFYDAVVRRTVHARASLSEAVDVATELDDALVAKFSPRGDIALAPKQIQHLHAVFTALRYMTLEAAAGSGLAPKEDAFRGLRSPADRRTVTLGALRYLCLQFREEKMRREVQARPRDAARGGIPGLIGDVRAYLNLNFDRGIPPQLSSGPRVDGMPLWPQVYYCLRAGDPRAALEIVEDALRDGTTSSSVDLFRDCLVSFIDSGDRRSLPDQQLLQLVHDYSMSVSYGRDSYQRVCYVVLARLDPAVGEKMALRDEDFSLLFCSIEDYLWLRLSIVHLDDDPAPPGALGMYCLRMTAVQNEILEFGAEHFDERGDSPVFYALILLLCGLFAPAIEYLENNARALAEATHVAFILYHYGMIRDDGQQKPAEVQEDDSTSFLHVSYSALLWRYISQFAADDPATAAVYLFTLRDAAVRNRLIEKLILSTHQVNVLLGDGPVTSPNRSKGVLEELWPLGGEPLTTYMDWVSIASSAAIVAERKGDRATAALLYDISGASEKVADILMQRLSAELTLRGSSGRGQALADARFYMDRLSMRQETVQASVGLRSLWALVQLAEFYDLLWNKEFERAWAVVHSVGILPESNDAIPGKIQESNVVFGMWKAAVCDCIPDVVFAAIQCLAGLETKSGQSFRRDVVRCLVSFVGLLPNTTADISAKLIQYELVM